MRVYLSREVLTLRCEHSKQSAARRPLLKRRRGRGFYDEDGNQYIDYVGSWGAMIMGHAHPEVVAAVAQSTSRGLGFGASTEIETRLAEKN